MICDHHYVRRCIGCWFDPRTRVATAAVEFPNTDNREFLFPTSGEVCDWILVLDRVS